MTLTHGYAVHADFLSPAELQVSGSVIQARSKCCRCALTRLIDRCCVHEEFTPTPNATHAHTHDPHASGRLCESV